MALYSKAFFTVLLYLMVPSLFMVTGGNLLKYLFNDDVSVSGDLAFNILAFVVCLLLMINTRSINSVTETNFAAPRSSMA